MLWQVGVQHSRAMAEALRPEGEWPRPSASGQNCFLAVMPPSHTPGAPAAPALASERELSR